MEARTVMADLAWASFNKFEPGLQAAWGVFAPVCRLQLAAY